MSYITIGNIVEAGDRLMDISGIREYCGFCGGKCCNHPDYFPDKCSNYSTCRKKPCVFYICKPLYDTIGHEAPQAHKGLIGTALLSHILLDIFSQMMPGHIQDQNPRVSRNILAIRETYDFSEIHGLPLNDSLKIIAESPRNREYFALCLKLLDTCLSAAHKIGEVCECLLTGKIDVHEPQSRNYII